MASEIVIPEAPRGPRSGPRELRPLDAWTQPRGTLRPWSQDLPEPQSLGGPDGKSVLARVGEPQGQTSDSHVRLCPLFRCP